MHPASAAYALNMRQHMLNQAYRNATASAQQQTGIGPPHGLLGRQTGANSGHYDHPPHHAVSGKADCRRAPSTSKIHLFFSQKSLSLDPREFESFLYWRVELYAWKCSRVIGTVAAGTPRTSDWFTVVEIWKLSPHWSHFERP